ncbi:MAG: alginate lyase family protein [Planctomycetes bacterium]|nr:alginate lyase family protein [Planctomycetota bacterium]
MQWTRAAAFAAVSLFSSAFAQDWHPPTAADLIPPVRHDAPILACSAAELANLRAGFGRGAAPLRSVVDAARARLGTPVGFPPRGGQHNQWYQCDACQRALTTVDDSHHRCPGCAEVYSGPPYDDVVFSRRHSENLRRAREAAWAFALSGETAFAADAATVVLGYADRYEGYPYHSNAADPTRRLDSGGHLMEQTLSEASMLVRDIAPVIDLIWHSLDAAQREHALGNLVRPMVANIAKCRRGKSNWQSWHNAAMFSAGVLLGDADWLRRSVLDPRHGFLFQMGASVSADGMWYENSFGYHNYTLAALCAHADAARLMGVDLFAHPSLRAMCALPARYVMANGRLPRLGDDVDSSPQGAAASLEAALAATRDARLGVVLSAEPSFESIRFGRDPGQSVPEGVLRSEVLRASGHAILRRGGAARMSALVTFAPFGGFHDHFDRLSFVWFAFGEERGVDPGRAKSQAYRLPIHGGWYRTTLAHNTVVVDGRPQHESGGELLGFVDAEDFVAVAAKTIDAYPGVEHARCLCLTDRYVLVLDRLRSESEHRFDWIYHDRGPDVRCALAVDEVAGEVGLQGEEFVEWLAQGETGSGASVDFGGGKVTTTLLVAAGGPTRLRLGTGPLQSVDDRAPFVALERRGAGVVFAGVLQAGTADHASDVTDLECREEGGALLCTVVWGAHRESWRWDGAGGFVRVAPR